MNHQGHQNGKIYGLVFPQSFAGNDAAWLCLGGDAPLRVVLRICNCSVSFQICFLCIHIKSHVMHTRSQVEVIPVEVGQARYKLGKTSNQMMRHVCRYIDGDVSKLPRPCLHVLLNLQVLCWAAHILHHGGHF